MSSEMSSKEIIKWTDCFDPDWDQWDGIDDEGYAPWDGRWLTWDQTITILPTTNENPTVMIIMRLN